MPDQPVQPVQPDRFPETDKTRYALRTKSAPLSASGTHEVVATAVWKTDLVILANAMHGSDWRKTYEIVRKRRLT